MPNTDIDAAGAAAACASPAPTGWPNGGWPNAEPVAVVAPPPNADGAPSVKAEKPPPPPVAFEPGVLLFTAVVLPKADAPVPAKALNAPEAGLINEEPPDAPRLGCPKDGWPNAEVVIEG